MKKILIPILLFASIVSYLSCQKEHSSDPTPVAAEKTEGIKKGEPVLFSVDGANAQWAVSPGNAKITTNGNTATILFAKAGSYQVTANTGFSVARITVNVSDSSWCNDIRQMCDSTGTDTCRYGNCPPRDTIPHDTIPRRDSVYSLHNDQIFITPIKLDSAGISGLQIKTGTQLSYPCSNNYLLTNVITAGNDTTSSKSYTFKYAGVVVPSSCFGPSVSSRSTKVIYPIQDGTHAFKVVLNGVTYIGSFTKTGSQYSFNWPYTSGVIISPQTIN